MSLIDDIRAGSGDAIKQLYQENAQEVYDFAKGITGNHDTAMQATRSTLEKLVKQIQAGDEPANIHSEALKLAYDEACKIAMPSVQNVKSPYDDEPEEEPKPAKSQKSSSSSSRETRQSSSRSSGDVRSKQRYYEDDYDESEREPVQRRGNKNQQQSDVKRSRRDYYEDDYDDRRNNSRRYDDRRYNDRRYDDRYDNRYDDYDDSYEKSGRGAGFYICLIINIILVLLLIWFLIGLLINLSVLPETLSETLGYAWFDQHIYPLF